MLVCTSPPVVFNHGREEFIVKVTKSVAQLLEGEHIYKSLVHSSVYVREAGGLDNDPVGSPALESALAPVHVPVALHAVALVELQDKV